MPKPNNGLRNRPQVDPIHTYIICISADPKVPGGYIVKSAGESKGPQKGNLSDADIMKHIKNKARHALPPRANPLDLEITDPTKIVFHLEPKNWSFTETQFKLTKGSENETQSASKTSGPKFEFGGLGWVTGGTSNETISVVDTCRRKEHFEYGLFLKIQQGNMSTIIEIDPRITN